MRLTVRDDLEKEAQLMREKRVSLFRQIKAQLRAVSFALERRIKVEMPVDTGRARASWGHWTPVRAMDFEGTPRDAVWEEETGGLAITQGSTVEYIEVLNAGRSTQAPRGFLDLAERWALEELDKEIDEIMRLW
jgi:hypothetical protein